VRKPIILLLLIFSFFSIQSYARLSYQLELPSRYIWRGFDLYPENNPAIQPSLTYTMGESGLSLNLWMGFALKERSKLKYFDEIDLTLTYTFMKVNNIEISTGFTHYGFYFAKNFSFKKSTSQEVFISAALPDSPFSPGLTVFYDFNLGSGLYINLEGSRTIRISKKQDSILSASLGFNSRQYIDQTGLSDLSFKYTVPVSLKKIIISPYCSISIPLMKTVNPKTEWWFGVIIALAD